MARGRGQRSGLALSARLLCCFGCVGGVGRRGWGVSGQGDFEVRAAIRGPESERAAVRCHKAGDEREAESDALFFGGEEGRQHLRLNVGGEPWAVVLDREENDVAALSGAEADVT